MREEMKGSMRRGMVVGAFVLAAAAGGCGVDGPASSTPGSASATPVVPATAIPSPVVHASVSLGAEHSLQFVEFKPGMTGTVETGLLMTDRPALTDDLKPLKWVDLYRHFAGAAATIPPAMMDAQARADAQQAAPAQAVPPPAAAAVGQAAGPGPHLYNDGEQAWFRNTFCNGAQNCVQAWDWTTMTSHWSISSGTGYAMVGSEGTTNATFLASYWTCDWDLFDGTTCIWLPFWQGIVVPGHWVSDSLTGGGNFIAWDLSGAGGNTQVSSAAKY